MEFVSVYYNLFLSSFALAKVKENVIVREAERERKRETERNVDSILLRGILFLFFDFR